jgi:TrpR family trp operon transcriptional repressor
MKRKQIPLDQDGWKDFIGTLSKLKTKKQLTDFFDLFLTRAEQDDIVLRYKIVYALLASEKTHRAIAKDLNASIAKVTRGSNALKIADPDIKKIFMRQ